MLQSPFQICDKGRYIWYYWPFMSSMNKKLLARYICSLLITIIMNRHGCVNSGNSSPPEKLTQVRIGILQTNSENYHRAVLQSCFTYDLIGISTYFAGRSHQLLLLPMKGCKILWMNAGKKCALSHGTVPRSTQSFKIHQF